jgi:hypothetical protein
MSLIEPAIRRYIAPVQVRKTRLCCSVKSPLELQIPMLRGTFGLALHTIDKTIYNNIFEGINPKLPLGQKQPRYIIRPDLNSPNTNEKSESFSFEFITWNCSEKEYDELLCAWDVAGLAGLGDKRIPFSVTKTTTEFCSLEHIQWNFFKDINSLSFPHSIRLMKKGQLIVTPNFYDVILAVLYRLAPIISQSVGKIPSAKPTDDWLPEAGEILDLAKIVKSDWQGEKFILQRYSARQQREVQQTGVFGTMYAENIPDDLHILLAIADLLHIGKVTIMGLGRCVPMK